MDEEVTSTVDIFDFDAASPSYLSDSVNQYGYDDAAEPWNNPDAIPDPSPQDTPTSGSFDFGSMFKTIASPISRVISGAVSGVTGRPSVSSTPSGAGYSSYTP